MSAIEIDLNPDKYVGFSLPFKSDKLNDFALTKNSLEQAQHNLKNLLLTYPGERVGQPEFGSKLREICFEQMDEDLPGKVEEEIRRAVAQWLGYIKISEVNTLTKEADLNNIHVQIKYSTVLNPDTMKEITIDATGAY